MECCVYIAVHIELYIAVHNELYIAVHIELYIAIIGHWCSLCDLVTNMTWVGSH